MSRDVANHQIGPRLSKRHEFLTIGGVRGLGSPRRHHRPSGRIDPEIKLVVKSLINVPEAGTTISSALVPGLYTTTWWNPAMRKCTTPSSLTLILFGRIAWFTAFPGWAAFKPRPKATETLSRRPSSSNGLCGFSF